MVSSGTFNYIDKRFQQIKDSTQPFGGITVVAVGDLYQLRPVGKYVFELSSNVMARIAGPVWQSHFHLVELCQIMRFWLRLKSSDDGIASTCCLGCRRKPPFP